MIITDEITQNKTGSKIEKKQENIFVEKLIKHLNEKEVELPDGSRISNMDGIIDSLIGKALDGDVAVIKLIRDLLNNR